MVRSLTSKVGLHPLHSSCARQRAKRWPQVDALVRLLSASTVFATRQAVRRREQHKGVKWSLTLQREASGAFCDWCEEICRLTVLFGPCWAGVKDLCCCTWSPKSWTSSLISRQEASIHNRCRNARFPSAFSVSECTSWDHQPHGRGKKIDCFNYCIHVFIRYFQCDTTVSLSPLGIRSVVPIPSTPPPLPSPRPIHQHGRHQIHAGASLRQNALLQVFN